MGGVGPWAEPASSVWSCGTGAGLACMCRDGWGGAVSGASTAGGGYTGRGMGGASRGAVGGASPEG